MEQTTESRILAEIQELKRYAVMGAKQSLNLSEAVLFTGLSAQRIYELTMRREIPHYKRGKKLYFDRLELDEWLKGIKVPTAQEAEAQAEINDFMASM